MEKRVFPIKTDAIEPSGTTDVLNADEVIIVDTAFDDIKMIITQHTTDAMIETGEYLLKTFFNDELDEMRELNVQDGPPTYIALAARFKGDPDSGRSLSWLYAARRVYIDYRDLKGSKRIFQTFEMLGVGHKMALTEVEELADKKKYIKQIKDEGLSVRDFKKLLKEGNKRGVYKKNVKVVLTSTRKQFTEKLEQIDELLDQERYQNHEELKKLKTNIGKINNDIGNILETVSNNTTE